MVMGEKQNPRKKKKKLEKVQSAAQQHKGKLYIIVACVSLLLCGCCSKQPKRPKRDRKK